jgi:hypothetical protein
VWGNSDSPTPFRICCKKLTNIILKNKEIKYKNYVKKYRSNPQYFKEKNYKEKILTRSIFKK